MLTERSNWPFGQLRDGGICLSHTTLPGQIPEPLVTETTTVNGIRLFTRSVGAGPDVIVLHGGPSASHISLLPALDELSNGRRLRYYDQRGCGGSPELATVPLDWQYHVSDLGELIDLWQIDKATVVGHSWGALLSLLYAIQHPKRIERLLLVTPAPITAVGRAEYLERLSQRMTDLGVLRQQRELLRSDLRRRDPGAFRQRAFDLTLAPYLKNPGKDLGMKPFHISHRVREAVWRSLGNFDLSGELDTIRVPALVLHGRFDPIPLSSSQRIAGLLGARLEIFEHSGHMPFFEEKERFLTIAEEFLS